MNEILDTDISIINSLKSAKKDILIQQEMERESRKNQTQNNTNNVKPLRYGQQTKQPQVKNKKGK